MSINSDSKLAPFGGKRGVTLILLVSAISVWGFVLSYAVADSLGGF